MTEILELVALCFIPGFMLLDLVYQGRPFEAPRWYRLRGLLVTIAVFGGSVAVTLFWGTLLQGVSLLDGTSLGIFGGAAVGILVYELCHYWYHRLAHRYDGLWLAAHQMHHSAEKVDAFGAYYLHPLDVFFFTSASALVFFPLLGLLPEAGAIAAVWLGFNAMFQHANVRTPHWLGYLVQRPESHILHHARGRHEYNYANLPLWDMIFGTFSNPRDVEGVEAGFYNGASARLFDMLRGRDVSKLPVVRETAPSPVSLDTAA
jgi:sterol desaturase/sphingolipid hydroxylase (fatty acid hydroxylase superfamily)